MSGLVGWVDFRLDLGMEEAALRSMTATMARRGPDTEGAWVSRNAALGYRGRSAAQPPRPPQPVVVEGRAGAVALVCAGTIYNLPELRADLAARGNACWSDSDAAKVLAHAFVAFGSAFVERLNGAFAIAVWDGGTQRLLLVRDRLGVKPLYYWEYPGGLLFASEPKGIMENRRFEARLNVAAIPVLLQPRLVMPGETPLLGLHEVPAAHTATFSQAGLAVRRYWALASEPHRDSVETTVRRVRELLEDIVGSQLSAESPPIAMLSGGLDSTSVAALAMQELRRSRSGAQLETFCVQFEADPEYFVATELRPDVDAPYAAAAARFIGARHHTVTVQTQDLLNAVAGTRRARDLPAWGQFDASMYLLFEEMRRTSTVALTGELADELFAGYPYMFKPEIVNRDGFPWMPGGPKLADYLAPDLRRTIDPVADERERYAQLLAQVPRLAGEDPQNARMREVLYLGLCGPTAVVLDREDRMSMSHGLEVRVPFADHRLVQYVWNVPWSMKTAGGVKGLLKAAMADLLPESTLNRKKAAYPQVMNPAYDRAIVEEATALIGDAQSSLAMLLDSRRIAALIDDIRADRAGVNGAHILIHIVELQRWLDRMNISLR